MKEDKIKNKKPRRISKSEEEKRRQLLANILDKWVCVKNEYAGDESFYYLKHYLGTKQKTTRIYQVLVSGFEEQDGIYEMSDYDLGYVYDAILKKKIVEIKPKKFDMKYGLYAENTNDIAPSYEALLDELVNQEITTKDELYAMIHGKFYQNLETVKLTYSRNFRNAN